jgi:hypothetical protein
MASPVPAKNIIGLRKKKKIEELGPPAYPPPPPVRALIITINETKTGVFELLDEWNEMYSILYYKLTF